MYEGNLWTRIKKELIFQQFLIISKWAQDIEYMNEKSKKNEKKSKKIPKINC